jgi:hypothetical protein
MLLVVCSAGGIGLLAALLLGCGTDAPGDATNARDMDAGADSAPCAPKTCVQLGANCGATLDGCGGTLDCGGCATGQTCGAAGPNKCGSGTCTPKTCVQLGASCGVASDSCSDLISCGSCEDNEVCGGGGVPNQCACVPEVSCASAGAECGSLVDDCGNTLACGNCGPGNVCGAAGPNRCGPEPCDPIGCSHYGYLCGVIDDGCGGTVSCGSCQAGIEVCHDHACCAASVTQPCSYACQQLQQTVRGYSQFESVWCSSENQSLASVVNCSAPDPDPCTTHGEPPGCGLVPGYSWCDVTCYRLTDCPGTTQCDGSCE